MPSFFGLAPTGAVRERLSREVRPRRTTEVLGSFELLLAFLGLTRGIKLAILTALNILAS